jgi:hypothetical protein
MKGKKKIHKVMSEFKDKTLKSSSGKKVTNRKQAIAIAMSEAGMSKGKSKPKTKKPKGGENPFFGNSLPFQMGEGKRWMNDSRKMGASSFKKG